MAENKKAIIVYAEWIELFEELEDDEAGRLIKHFFRYVNDLEPKTTDRITKLSFIPIKQTLKRDLEKWEKTLEGRSKAGKASAKARINKKQQKSTNSTSVKCVKNNLTNSTDSVNVNVNDSVNVKDKVINNILYRETQFKKLLQPFLKDYNKTILNDFYLYWTEKKPKGKKMRFEMEKTFDISRRLIRWNNNQFNKKDSKPISLAEKMKKRYGL